MKFPSVEPGSRSAACGGFLPPSRARLELVFAFTAKHLECFLRVVHPNLRSWSGEKTSGKINSQRNLRPADGLSYGEPRCLGSAPEVTDGACFLREKGHDLPLSWAGSHRELHTGIHLGACCLPPFQTAVKARARPRDPIAAGDVSRCSHAAELCRAAAVSRRRRPPPAAPIAAKHPAAGPPSRLSAAPEPTPNASVCIHPASVQTAS